MAGVDVFVTNIRGYVAFNGLENQADSDFRFDIFQAAVLDAFIASISCITATL